MKKLYIAVLTLLVGSAQAQLTITDNLSTASIADLLEGLNVSIQAVQVNCAGTAMGHFTGGSDLGIEEGILLTTGEASSVAAPASSFTSGTSGTGSNTDLVVLSGGSINDACVLEFDCIPLGDTLLFNYVFGSEEYPEYVCTSFNDVFGHFISGPGISGPFSNNGVNIALLPNSTIPVAINTVNSGAPGMSGGSGALCEAADPNWQANSVYYVDNLGGLEVCYDGFTVLLEALCVVVPGETYHFKLAIGDGSDSAFDSGVFLQAYSFRSTGLSTGVPRHASAMRVITSADGITVLASSDAVGAELRILDASGRIAMRERITAERSFFGTQALAKGVYTAVPVGVNGLKPVRFVKE